MIAVRKGKKTLNLHVTEREKKQLNLHVTGINLGVFTNIDLL